MNIKNTSPQKISCKEEAGERTGMKEAWCETESKEDCRFFVSVLSSRENFAEKK